MVDVGGHTAGIEQGGSVDEILFGGGGTLNDMDQADVGVVGVLVPLGLGEGVGAGLVGLGMSGGDEAVDVGDVSVRHGVPLSWA